MDKKTKYRINAIFSDMKNDILFLDGCFNEDKEGNYSCKVESFSRTYENLNCNMTWVCNIVEENNLIFLIDDVRIITKKLLYLNNLFDKMYCTKKQNKFFDIMLHYENILKNLLWHIFVLESKFNKM